MLQKKCSDSVMPGWIRWFTDRIISYLFSLPVKRTDKSTKWGRISKWTSILLSWIIYESIWMLLEFSHWIFTEFPAIRRIELTKIVFLFGSCWQKLCHFVMSTVGKLYHGNEVLSSVCLSNVSCGFWSWLLEYFWDIKFF